MIRQSLSDESGEDSKTILSCAFSILCINHNPVWFITRCPFKVLTFPVYSYITVLVSLSNDSNREMKVFFIFIWAFIYPSSIKSKLFEYDGYPIIKRKLSKGDRITCMDMHVTKLQNTSSGRNLITSQWFENSNIKQPP